MFGMGMWRILLAFLYGVMLGVLWECASMCVLLAATLVEHFCGTLVMAVLFLGFAAMAFAVAARADLGRPLLSIMAFRLTAQLAMTLGTGSILLTTMLHDTPVCTSDLLRTSGWRGPLLGVLRNALPHRVLRRIVGVEPPCAHARATPAPHADAPPYTPTHLTGMVPQLSLSTGDRQSDTHTVH